MGILVSRFKSKKTTLEILESLENRIKSVEETGLHTAQRQRKIVGHLILYSVGVYVVAAVLFYFLYFPASLQDQLFSITPLVIFPIIVVFMTRLVTWYYRRKLTRNQEKLHGMREEKKKLLEDVMDNETYKIAKQILEKYAPDHLQKSSSMAMPARLSGPPDLSVHRRTTSSSLNTSIPQSPPPTKVTSSIVSLTPETNLRRQSQQQPPVRLWSAISHNPAVYVTPSGQINGQGSVPRPPGPPMPRPILPRDRSYLDKLVEYLVGDGPSNRYALICKQCESHNGMALKEEFEYFAFRCCYCFYWNPARKQRPQAPRLPLGTGRSESPGHTFTSEMESSSDTEEDSSSEQSFDMESPSKEGEVKIAEVAAEDLAPMSENDEPASTEGITHDRPLEDKPSSPDTEATEVSDS